MIKNTFFASACFGLLLAVLSFLTTACQSNEAAPVLGQADQPTLVFVYTDA